MRVCELGIMFSSSIRRVRVSRRCCSLGPMLEKKQKQKKIFHGVSHAEFMRTSQSNMLDNMLGLSVTESCCAVVFLC